MKAVKKGALILALWVGLSVIWFAGVARAQSAELEEADRLSYLAGQLYQQRKYVEALPFAQRALDIREKVLGPEHPDVATTLNGLGLIYHDMGGYAAYATAEPLYKRSLAIREKTYGSEHPAVAQSLRNLAELYHLMGNYPGAEPLFKRSLKIREKTLGPDHSEVGVILSLLANLYVSTGNFEAAESFYKRSLSIMQKELGIDHPETTKVQNALASLKRSTKNSSAIDLAEAERLDYQLVNLYRQGKYGEAVPFAQKALNIREKALGPEHLDVSVSLNTLALLYDNMGNYAAAEPLYKRSLSICEKVLGPEHPRIATPLYNLATLYFEMGNYAAAEPLYKRSLSISEKALGPEHPDTTKIKNALASLNKHAEKYSSSDLEEATRLNNLSIHFYIQGKYAEAVPYAQMSFDLMEKALGPEHPSVGISLQNLARLYRDMGNYAAAEPLFKRSLLIFENAQGPEHLSVATSLNYLAELYRAMGNYALAEPMLKRSLAISEKALGPEHPDVATILNNQAGLYRNMGNYADAEPLYKRSLAIAEKALGPEHPDVATILNNQADLYRNMGNYAAAEPLYKRSLAIVEKALGPEHPDVATILNNQADLYRNVGNYADAEPLYKRSLAISEKALGPEHPDVAISLNNLALVNIDMGNYAAAEPMLKRSLAIKEKTLGPEHPGVAQGFSSLALLYKIMGNYTAAEPLYKRSLAIAEKAAGPELHRVAATLNNLAELYRAMGNYAEAEPLYKRSLAIGEKALGPHHPDVAISLNNLARFYEHMGNYAAAEPLFKRSLEISEKALGPHHPSVAISLNNIAVLNYAAGDYASAELFYKRSLTIQEKALGPEHPSVAQILSNLASLYYAMGNYASAELFYKRSLTIQEKALGPEHPSVAAALNNLAVLYRAMGNYAAEEPLYKRSLAIAEKALGPEHPDVGTSLRNLSYLKAALGNNQQSLELMMRAQSIDEAMIEQVAGFTSSEQTMQYLNTIQRGTEACFSLVNSRLKENSLARKKAFGVWLRRKGVVLEAQRWMQQALLETGDREVVKVFEELTQTRTRLAELSFAGPGKESPQVYQRKLKDLNVQEEELESRLSRLSQPYAQSRKARKVTVEEVMRALHQGTALVDFARINVLNFDAKGNEKKWLPAHYLAFVLRSGQGQDVALVDLGTADEIDAALNQFKNAVKQKQDAKARDLGRKLHDLIFLPLQKELGGAKRIFLSPDDALNLLPFEVLRDPEEKYLIERYTFNYLAAGRDLVGFSEKKASAEKSLLLGDPDFDLDSNKKSQALDRLGMRLDSAVASVRSAVQRNFRFDRLPNTRKEVNAIGDLLGKGQCEVFLDSSALEEVLQARKAPRILHLATHGFFLKDQELPETRGIGGMISFAGMDQGFGRPTGPRVSLENPLLRSGIALAGANRANSSGPGSDGILTADEVLSLRLRGTELVVLSACETGLGEVRTGEGVFGLRRAFAQAGARSMVMSMWSVPDEPTKDLMVEFYKNILSGKLDRCQALRQAALKMKQKYGENPFFWGAFVFLGQAD